MSGANTVMAAVDADATPWRSWPDAEQAAIRLECHADGGLLWIDMLAIPEGKRGEGVGAKLWRHFEASLPPSITCIKLMAADTGSGPSRGFWCRMGFQVESRTQKHGIIMRKENPAAAGRALC